MQSITVAIADVDCGRRAKYERLLLGEDGIKLLSNVEVNDGGKEGLESGIARSRQNLGGLKYEIEVDRIKRLNPVVTLVKVDMDVDEDQALFLSLRSECPEARIVLLADDAIQESRIIQALEIGARGYLKNEAVEHNLTRAVHAVGRGEAWVPRKMLGRILDRMLNKREAYRLAN
ncbi:MAG: DNA-binding response regulator [Gammaproteobacteria bacterium]|nr:DNA-binding response regulator [Gammaproteobacteria bacterium]MBU1776044.1 DNA-binding response regulator [Gammaproteobacteria bacterium]MBU1969747.1 DNA-binding response regulator [Gammaproteobacteria bacterium]